MRRPTFLRPAGGGLSAAVPAGSLPAGTAARSPGPVAHPTRVQEPSGRFAAFQPHIVTGTGKGLAGSIDIPVVEGDLRFGG